MNQTKQAKLKQYAPQLLGKVMNFSSPKMFEQKLNNNLPGIKGHIAPCQLWSPEQVIPHFLIQSTNNHLAHTTW